MKSSRLAAFVVLCAASMAAQGGQPPPMPKPGPEHAVFKMDEGTWDAVVEMAPAPGAPVQKSKGVEVNTVGCGGLCLISDFKGDMMGMPFHGHGVSAWDPSKKKYIGSWTDSMSSGLGVGESTYDPAKKMATGTMEGPDATGKVTKSRSTVEYTTPTARVMRMYAPGPDGKEMEMFKITLTKRK